MIKIKSACLVVMVRMPEFDFFGLMVIKFSSPETQFSVFRNRSLLPENSRNTFETKSALPKTAILPLLLPSPTAATPSGPGLSDSSF